jgi:hypothetical protein
MSQEKHLVKLILALKGNFVEEKYLLKGELFCPK